MFIEEKIKVLEDEINKLKAENEFNTYLGDSGTKTTIKDVVRALCKKSNIDIRRITITYDIEE